MKERVKPKLKFFPGNPSFLLHFIQWLVRWLSEQNRIALREKLRSELRPEIPYYQADWRVIDEVLRKQVGDVQRFLVDSTYWLTGREGLRTMLDWDWTQSYVWKAERRDCDDMAFYLKTHASEYWDLTALAWAWGAVYEGKALLGLHAWVIAVIYDEEKEDLRVIFIEPQTDAISGSNVVEGLRYETYGMII